MNHLLKFFLLGMSTCLITSAHAVKQGHSRLVSLPGQPLEIIVPITELTSEDLNVLKVEVASPALWAQSGMSPPVALDQLRVSMTPSSRPDGRQVVVQSSQPSNRQVVDMLLTLSTASGSRQLQVSLLQPAFAPVDLASSRTSIKVQPGDTLYGIAQRNLVPGATIHQMLWALYEANPGAFISENMNLLRAGAVLTIPDAKTVLAIDPALARSRFAEHDTRFKSLRGKRVGAAGQPPVVGATSASAGKVTPKSQQSASEQTPEDRLRLSTTQQDRESDQQASRKKEIAENQARVGELQQNIQQMQQALGQTSGAASAATGVAAGQAGSNSTAVSTSNAVSGGPGSASPTSNSGALPAGSPQGTVQAADSASGSQSVASGLPNAALQNTSGQGQKESAVATQWLKDNLLVVLTALLAIVAFLIGMRMRRESSRRDDESDDPDVGEVSPAAKTAFEKKLQSIDLNLDSPEASPGEPKKSTH